MMSKANNGNKTTNTLRSATAAGRKGYGAPMFVLTVTTACTIGAIVYSHYSQVRDKEEMRDGVRRDKERLRLKRQIQKTQNQQQ